MKLVIDIPEDEYNIAKYGQYGKINVDIVRKALADGTPLPKGHGRIIDESKIKVCEWVDVAEECYPKVSTDAPTIIEADGGGEE